MRTLVGIAALVVASACGQAQDDSDSDSGETRESETSGDETPADETPSEPNSVEVPSDWVRAEASCGFSLLAPPGVESGPFGRLRASDRALVRSAIDRVGLGEQASAPVATLSGGQQQRAFIAKALAGEPDLLVLDEPTAGVDVDAQESLATLLAELHDELDTSILFVSHEFGAVEQFVERLVLVRGGIVFDGPPSALPGQWHDPCRCRSA